MRFVFGTDIHGDLYKLKRLLEIALEHGASCVVLGGDIAPKHGDLFESQYNFYKRLREMADEQLLPVYVALGNDDVKCLEELFKQECNKSHNLQILQPTGMIEDMSYMHYNYVPDYPFGLKDWCKNDFTGFIHQTYRGTPVLSKLLSTNPISGQFVAIKDSEAYFKQLSTIEEDLSQFKGHYDLAFIHCPPASVHLDVCYGYVRVGSVSIYNWLKTAAPCLSLHGHIHENPDITGKISASIDTVSNLVTVAQPGNRRCLVIDIDKTGVYTADIQIQTVLY